MRALSPIVCAMVAGVVLPCRAEAPTSRPADAAVQALASAADVQRQVLRQLAQILREQKISLSDGAMLSSLQELLANMKKQRQEIMTLGRATLGKSQDQLTPTQRQQLDRLVQNQRMYASRYQYLQSDIERKALSRPESSFAAILAKTTEVRLLERFREAASLLEANRLARALPHIDVIIRTLEELIATMSGTPAEQEPTSQPGEAGFALQSLVLADPNMGIPQFPWSGDVVDALGEIMRSVRQLEELAKRQRQIAAQVAKLAGSNRPEKKLGREEFEIRFYAIRIAEKIGVLDALVDREIRSAGQALRQAGQALQDGRTAQAVAPAKDAAEQLTRAAVGLRKAWDDILKRLAKYTAEAELVVSSSFGIPHGASKEWIEKLRQKIMKLLRATRALTEAIGRQTQLKDQTTAAHRQATAGAGAKLATPQQALAQFLADEVIPYNVAPDKQSGKLGGVTVIEGEDKAGPLLEDARNAMHKAGKQLRSEQLTEAIAEQTEALDCMGDALRIMIVILQKLLGQYAPPGLAQGSGGQVGVAAKVSRLGRIGAGWAWNLPPRKRAELRQAFRGNFPARYERLIKLYYMNIAKEEPGQ